MNSRKTAPWRAWGFIALVAIAATGCGNLTGGGFADMTLSASGDEEEPSPAPSAASASAPARSSHVTAVGLVDARFSAYLTNDTGETVRIGNDELRALRAIDGTDAGVVKVQVVPEDRYTELRLVFSSVTATVFSGLPIIGDVTVSIANDRLEVTTPLDLNLREGDDEELAIDLNATAWLLAADPVTLAIDPAVFAALVEVELR